MTPILPDLNRRHDELAPYREPTQTREVVLDGKIFRAERHTVALPDGKEAVRELVYHGGGAAILALDREECVYLVAQYRKAVESFLWEIPAGKLEEGEDPERAAVRELKEETGLRAGKIEKLGVLIPTAGYCSEKIHIYLATSLMSGDQDPDEDEYLRLLRLPFRDALQAVRNGEIEDAKTAYALLRLADRRARRAGEASHGTEL